MICQTYLPVAFFLNTQQLIERKSNRHTRHIFKYYNAPVIPTGITGISTISNRLYHNRIASLHRHNEYLIFNTQKCKKKTKHYSQVRPNIPTLGKKHLVKAALSTPTFHTQPNHHRHSLPVHSSHSPPLFFFFFFFHQTKSWTFIIILPVPGTNPLILFEWWAHEHCHLSKMHQIIHRAPERLSPLPPPRHQLFSIVWSITTRVLPWLANLFFWNISKEKKILNFFVSQTNHNQLGCPFSSPYTLSLLWFLKQKNKQTQSFLLCFFFCILTIVNFEKSILHTQK